MRTSIIILCLFISHLVLASSEMSVGQSDVHKPGASIYDVKGMGNWKKGSRGGQVRLVITRMAKQDEVFLQWVQWNEKGPEKVKATAKIKEIEERGRFQVDFIRRETEGHSRQIVLGLENLHDKSSTRIVIQVQDLGIYTSKFE